MKLGALRIVVTVYSVTLTCACVVAGIRVQTILETGISLMELGWDSPVEVVIFFSFVELRELSYIVETMLSHHLVYITVRFQLMPSIMTVTPQ